MKKVDLTGMRCGRLTVLKECDARKNKSVVWLCQCDCGNQVFVSAKHLTTQAVKSCGCLKHEQPTKHGLSQSRLYRIYHGMIERCYYQKHIGYDNYGARGVWVCEEWKNDFSSFANWALENGYSDELSLDRINCDGGYCPQNCRWVDCFVQQRNKHNNRRYIYNNQYLTVAELAEIGGLNYHTLTSRLNRGWDVQKAVETPLVTA